MPNIINYWSFNQEKRQERRGITTEKEAKNQFFSRKHGWPLEKRKRIYSYSIRLSSKRFLNINIIVQSLSHVWFFTTLWTVACQAPLPMEISRQEYWSGLPFPSLGDIPEAELEPASPALAGRFFTTEPPGKPQATVLSVLVAQSCLTLYNPMDCSLPGTSAYGILQARILECVSIPFTRGSSWCRDQT